MTETDAVLNVLLSLGILQGTRRFLQTKTRLPDWDAWLLQLRIPTVVVQVILIMREVPRLDVWLWVIPVGLIANTLRLLWLHQSATLLANRPAWFNWQYRPFRTVVWAITPLLLLIVIEQLAEAVGAGFYKASQPFFSSVGGFVKSWTGILLIVAWQQRKTLAKQELERQAQEAHNRQIEAENMKLEDLVVARTAELTRQKEELLHTVADLKATQEQLVQKEKMASLGELTAGIAHEIQNPLNFVNNFAEVSVELIDELGEELQAGHIDDVQALMDDIRQNLEKINYHGHRADGIVKAMLQHSRSSTGERQPTDLNALCDEFLRLSYHGLRAKDSSFNATMLTDFDPAVGKLTMVSQEIGRVLLNLFNNAFYAVSEKKKHLATPAVDGRAVSTDYQPTLKVSTKRAGDVVRIRVYDNGCGIPQSVLDKIYQPFFTTKPTGEGTGLGLSLSYDIVTKGHKGTLSVTTSEGEFTEFLIELPY